MRSSGIYAKHARIGKANHVCDIEDQRKHDDGDEPGRRVTSQIKNRIHNIIRLTHDRLNLSKETKKRLSQRAGKTYSAVQKNLRGSISHLWKTADAWPSTHRASTGLAGREGLVEGLSVWKRWFEDTASYISTFEYPVTLSIIVHLFTDRHSLLNV